MSRRALGWAAIALALAPTSALSQARVLVEGRVVETGTTDGIQNALVELIGHGATLTAGSGVFRFEGVAERGYVLRVDGFGYDPTTRFVSVRGETWVEVELDIDPLPLDSLVVAPRTIELDGRVRDPTRDLNLVGADVLTNQVEGTETNDHGRFSLDDVFEHVPLRLMVSAVGYLTVDTVVLPDEDRDLLFDMQPDLDFELRAAAQVRRLERRAAPRAATLMPALNREDLLRWAGRTNLQDALEWEYWRRMGGVVCVFVDERELTGLGATTSLWTLLPEEVERVESLFGGAMIRVYTRDFMARLVAGGITLRRPYMAPGPPPICQ